MANADAGHEPMPARCPHCGAVLAVPWPQVGGAVECPSCGQPFEATPPAPKTRVEGRLFQFQCLRCGSVLEARSSQSGREGRCPGCAAKFIVPQLDPRTGLARTHADPGDDGENPAPVHAYAAAGDMAPRIERRDDDSLVILCPRCSRESPVGANNCPRCGLPFTMEGMTYRPSVSSAGPGLAAVVLACVAIPLAFCGGSGIVPALIAVGMGVWDWREQGHRVSTASQVAIYLGLAGVAVSVLVLLRFLG